MTVECTRCRAAMEPATSRAWRCPRCRQTVSQAQADVFRAAAGARVRRQPPDPGRQARFEETKARLERWLARVVVVTER